MRNTYIVLKRCCIILKNSVKIIKTNQAQSSGVVSNQLIVSNQVVVPPAAVASNKPARPSRRKLPVRKNKDGNLRKLVIVIV